MNTLPKPEPTEGAVIVGALKKQYFTLLAKENINHTPELTTEIDQLEAAIARMTRDLEGASMAA